MRSRITPEQFEKEVAKLTNILDRTRRLGLQKAERINRVRGAAEARELARVMARDGLDSPVGRSKVADLVRQTRTTTELRENLRTADVVSGLKRASTIAVGKVVTEKGEPASDLRVVVTTDSGRAVGNAVVDSSGLYVFDMSRREFNRLVTGSKELVVSVHDASGRTLRETRTPVEATTVGALLLNVDLAVKIQPDSGPIRHSGPASPTSTPPVETPSSPTGPSLSDIRGVGPARITRLKEANITDLASLIRMNPEELGRILGVDPATAEDFIGQARRLHR